MGFVIFSNNQGCGYIEDSKENLIINAIPVKLGGTTINPGDKTNINDYLNKEIEFLGLKDENEMIFYLGSENDLFKSKHYYQAIFWIAENRFFEMFSPIAGRDFNFIKGEWK